VVRLLFAVSLVAGCYSPHPQPGSPCPDGVCATGLVCAPDSQICVRPEDLPDAGICAAGDIVCSGTCVDPTSDPNHCGGCSACSVPNATAACVAGQCEVTGCTANACMISGSCQPVTFDSDPMHCGSCTNKCSSGTCESGACVLRAFVTVTAYSASLGGLGGADAKCQTEADAHALGGRWKAWLADANGAPAGRFTHGQAAYQRLDGKPIAQNWNKLTMGTLLNPLNIMSNKATATNTLCWSNVTAAGTRSTEGDCTSWGATTNTLSGGRGQNNLTDSSWTDSGSQNCDPTVIAALPLYCFEQ
jgi:hypothetical protein